MPPKNKGNKKAVKDSRIKNHGKASGSRAVSPSSSDRRSLNSFDNLHRDELGDLGTQLEQGELILDSDDADSDVPAAAKEVKELLSSSTLCRANILFLYYFIYI